MSASPLAPDWLALPADPNLIGAGLWPASARRGDTGALEVGGVSVDQLAGEFGTPLYVIDEADARGRAERIRAAAEAAFGAVGADVTVYYAGKALLTTEIVRWMDAAGLAIDVCTSGEFAVTQAAGFDPSRLGFHGNNKGLAELDETIGAGIGTIVLDSVQEVARVADLARTHDRLQRVRLRVNTGVHAHTHEYLATAREDQKFGIPLAEVPDVVALIRAHDSLDFVGLHAHIGSQIFDDAGFVESARRLMRMHTALSLDAPVPELNLGGGFGIAYTPADDPSEPDEIFGALAAAVAAAAAEFGVSIPHISVEPGRWIIGPAGITLYSVGTTKDVTVDPHPLDAAASAHPLGTFSPSVAAGGRKSAQLAQAGAGAGAGAGAVRRYVSVDGGMGDNVRPALYGADYTVRLAGRSVDAHADQVLVRLAGKHCESGDIVVRDDYLPADIAPGDLVAVAATGAYCWSLSSNYNWVGRAPIVAVRDGVARMLVRGQSPADLLRYDTGAA